MHPVTEVDNPDWGPLENVLSPNRCAEFMYMGRSGDIVLYKHVSTRRYLNIDRNTGYFYRFVESRASRIDKTQALRYVYE